MSDFTTRVATRATSLSPVRVLLAVLVAPFWLVGAVAALGWLVLSWAWAALLIGFGDVAARGRASKPAVKPDGVS